jgi:hypothetical protein
MKVRAIIGAVGVTGVLLLAGCSDDGESTGGATTPDTQAGPSGGDVLTRADGEAFYAVLASQTDESEAYVECVALKVRSAAEAGDITAKEVRDWTAGEQLDTDLQEFITSPDVVTGCYAEIASSTTGAG